MNDQPVPISKLISDLASADAHNRAPAAAELYRRGTELGAAAIDPWLHDAELAPLLIHDHAEAFGALSATVGVAVFPASFVRIRARDGSLRLANVPPDQDALEFELNFPPNVRLDILTTKAVGAGGAIAKYLEKFGEGIQQIEYLTEDVDRAAQLLRQRFTQEAIYSTARAGADNTRVNFFLVDVPGGKKILIEFVEAPSKISKSPLPET